MASQCLMRRFALDADTSARVTISRLWSQYEISPTCPANTARHSGYSAVRATSALISLVSGSTVMCMPSGTDQAKRRASSRELAAEVAAGLAGFKAGGVLVQHDDDGPDVIDG